MCKPLPYLTFLAAATSAAATAATVTAALIRSASVERVNASRYSCYLCTMHAVHSIIIHLDFILICCGCQCLFINNYTSFVFCAPLRSSRIGSSSRCADHVCAAHLTPGLSCGHKNVRADNVRTAHTVHRQGDDEKCCAFSG